MSDKDRTQKDPGAPLPEPNIDDKQWQNLQEFVDDEQFVEVMQRKFPREAEILRRSGMSRRSFLTLMGATMVAGGLSLTGCTPARREHEAILPYARMPENVIPGKPLFFASAMVLGGYATGVLIETHEGRPQRIEGNPNHPASLGGSGSMQLASILELYNPLRAVNVLNNGEVSTFEAFSSALETVIASLGSSDSSGLRVLVETTTSPSLAKQLDDLVEKYPGARWYQYEPLTRSNVVEGARIAFGEAVDTVYHFDGADVILALDVDFLMSLPGSLRYARDFANRRKVRADSTEMNRLYAVECTPTNTGAMADSRIALNSANLGSFVLALADALGVDGGQAADNPAWDVAWFDALVADLEANAGSSIVVVGDEQPAAIHALVHAINDALNNAGSTITYVPPAVQNLADANSQLAELVGDMAAGNVDALFILGGNPAYNAPVDIPFAEAMARVPFSVHLGLYNDETSQNATWHIPQTYYIEAWGDARAYDGTVSIIQPPIGALYDNARSDREMIALIAEDDRSAYDILRAYWEESFEGDDFEAMWRRTLHDGVMADSASEAIQPALVGDLGGAVDDMMSTMMDGLELIVRPDPALYDGRFANNSWLQELPHPLTKISWDNTLMMAPATAASLGFSNGDLVNVSYQGRSTQAPVWIVSGHAEDSATLYLGYGHGIGADVEAGLSFDVYPLRDSNTPWIMQGVELSATGQNYPLALTQKSFDTFGTEPVLHGTLASFVEDPEGFISKGKYDASLIPGFEYNDNAWGMSIDLTACIGCNACITACQSENNIPAVGKTEVLQDRDMFWIRVDRYDVESETLFQPVPCMHCESAPCEQVCPVQATVHDHEGLNSMVYNRCVGTRSCGANCPYSVRRFNYLDYVDDETILVEQRNPDVSVRPRGVMEKCTYCVQRINEARIAASNENRAIRDGEVVPACASSCPTQAIIFGNINDPAAAVTQEKAQPHSYGLLEELNTKPRTTYLARLSNPNDALNGEAAEADVEG